MTVVDRQHAGETAAVDRKRLGSWYTPPDLVDRVVHGVLDAQALRDLPRHRPIRVVDPACGDGRFLAAVASRLADADLAVDLVGVDVDPEACAAARASLSDARILRADTLGEDWRNGDEHFDLVIGNPPYLSQLAAATARGGSSAWGGGPYADAAAEFLGVAAAVVEPDGGRVAFVLPQSILASRDAAPVRALYDRRAEMVWSWWSPDKAFDAQVHTCALAFRFGTGHRAGRTPWSRVVTDRAGVPTAPDLAAGSAGTLGDRAWVNANFRDEYYGLVAAVGDHPTGPPLVTSGLIDPGRCLWGERSVRFAKRSFRAPRVDVAALDGRMRRWAERRRVPKVLVANQTPIVEAVCDPAGEWLPGVPVVAVYPDATTTPWEVAALLTSPAVSAWAWNHQAGSGLSPSTIRISPDLLAGLPWPGPAGSCALVDAVRALRAGDVRGCGRAVHRAFRLDADDGLDCWWEAALARIEGRSVGEWRAGGTKTSGQTVPPR